MALLWPLVGALARMAADCCCGQWLLHNWSQFGRMATEAVA
jgi:hypothetical protein